MKTQLAPFTTFFLLVFALTALGSTFGPQMKLAKRDLKKKGGKQYDEQVGHHFTRRYYSQFKRCTKNWSSKDPVTVDLVVKIAKTGKVQSLHKQRSVPIIDCIITGLQNEKFPKPPFSPFHAHIALSVGDQPPK